jgi:hypothetical protein
MDAVAAFDRHWNNNVMAFLFDLLRELILTDVEVQQKIVALACSYCKVFSNVIIQLFETIIYMA